MSSMTRLDAVNQMLDALGEDPVETLSSGLADAEAAERILAEVSRDVQSKGYACNTDDSLVLQPDVDGYIFIPATTLRIDTIGQSKGINVVQRGTRLYNRGDATFKFTASLTVELVTELAYEDLPYSLAFYIAKRAARVYQERSQGSISQDSLVARAEAEAKAVLEDDDAEQEDANILARSGSVASILRGYNDRGQ